MPKPATMPDDGETRSPSFGEYDRIKLKKAVRAEGKAFGPGLQGTILHCHGTAAYEVEFDGVHDFFAIPGDALEKI